MARRRVPDPQPHLNQTASPDPASMQRHRAVDTTAATVMVVLCALWGLGQIAIKVGVEGISPIFQAGLRSAGAAVIVLAWMAARGIRPWPAVEMILPGIAIGVLFAIEFICFYQGLTLTTASRATVLIYTAPFFVAIGGHFLFNDPLSRRKALGLVLAFAGVAFAMADHARGTPAEVSWIGDLLCVAAGLFWGLTTVLIKSSALRAEQAERALLYQLVVSAIVMLALAPLLGEAGFTDPTPLVWMALAYQILVVASFSYLGWFMLIRNYSPSQLSAFTFLTPVFGVAFAAVLLREPVGASLLAALALIAGGIWLVNRP